MTNLCGIHDLEGVAITPPDTWLLDTVALSESPTPRDYTQLAQGREIIARLNWGYGSTGTLPQPALYEQFAQAAASFVQGCRGCTRWVIGNEPNLPREWPQGLAIYPGDYAECFRQTAVAIRRLAGHRESEMLLAPVGPWNTEFTYPGNEKGDWLVYFEQMLAGVGAWCDGFALHAYTHGYDPSLVTSSERMDAEGFTDRYYHFRTYQDNLEAIPYNYWNLPVYITEANGDGPWQAVGLMPAMLEEIDNWNHNDVQPVRCVIFYRYPQYDAFYIDGRVDVMNEYSEAVAMGYPSPAIDPAPIPEPIPEAPSFVLAWDDRLSLRGTALTTAIVSAGQWAWRLIVGQWFDPQQAQGRINVFVTLLDPNGNLITDIPVTWFWQDGEETKLTEVKHDDWLGHPYSLDFSMNEIAPSYGVRIGDGEPSGPATDILWGMGLGSIEDPYRPIHTAYSFTFQMQQGLLPDPIPPEPPQAIIQEGFVTAQAGLNVRAGPGTHYPILGTLDYGSSLLSDRGEAGWLKLAAGWVLGDYVSPEKPTVTAPAPTPPPSVHLVHPLPGSVITQHWGESAPEYVAGMWGHSGVDLGGVPAGTPVRVMADGVVIVSSLDSGYGNFVIVRHDPLAKATLYAHLRQAGVGVGTTLRAGDRVGAVGSTGNSTGDHLHFEVRDLNADGSYKENSPMPKGRIDPETYCFTQGVTL